MLIYFPVLVCLAGLIILFVATKPPIYFIGQSMFACGLLVSLFEIGQKVIRLP